jgi:mono/diheme cytochrome c family protein
MMFSTGIYSRSTKRKVTSSLLIIASTLILQTGTVLSSEELPGDQVALGAWLFRDNCTRCHINYGKAQLAQQYDDRNALIKAIGNKGCRINWEQRSGGPFGRQELEALADYMLKWEALQGEPPLPELPPAQVKAPPRIITAPQKERSANPVTFTEPDQYPAALQLLVARDPIAHGGLLYTRNCHRCHLTYKKARMGKGLSSAAVQRFITEGKTSTQMRPFSQVLGGQLSTKEIRAIVTYIERWEVAGEELALAKLLLTPPSLDPSEMKPLRLPRFPKVKGKSGIGKKLFSRHCSPCHGNSAEGYIGSNLQQPRWVLRADLFLKSVIKQGVPGSIMVGQDHRGDYHLAPKDIDDLVTFLLDLQEESGRTLGFSSPPETQLNTLLEKKNGVRDINLARQVFFQSTGDQRICRNWGSCHYKLLYREQTFVDLQDNSNAIRHKFTKISIDFPFSQ